MWHGDLEAVYVDGRSPDGGWEPFETYREAFEHPKWAAYRDAGVREQGHGGSDHLVLRDYVASVRTGERPPIDVYDTAAWMAISPLSERSVSRGGTPVDVPEFTNGDWMAGEPRFAVSDAV